jgi:hypothetical protein
MNAPLITITDVLRAQAEPGILRSLHLDAPQVGEADTYAIELSGWVMGHRLRPVKLELEGPDIETRPVPLGLPRPDLAEHFPDIPWAASHSGFRTRLSVLGLPTEFTLTLVVVLEDGSRARVATILGRHEMPAADGDDLQPLMITTLGRTGSTWITGILGSHPSILTYPPFQHEVRVASYWVDVLLALSEPASYLQSVQAFASRADWWLGRERIYDEATSDRELLRWLGRDHVEQLVRFCKGRIEEFYVRVAAAQPGKAPEYFAEKTLPGAGKHVTALRGLYRGTREVFLVRDFRDVFCSIVAFNRKRGYDFFNRNLASSDEDYVRNYLGPDVQRLLEAWRRRSEEAHLLRYEDLVVSPYETLNELLEYLNLERSRAIVDRMLPPQSLGVREPSNAEHRTTASAAESVGRWREDLSSEMVAVCNEAFAEALEAFDYLDGEPWRAQGVDAAIA